VAELTLPYPGAELRQQPDDWTSLTTDANSFDNLDIDPLSLEDLNLDNVEALLSEDISVLDNPLAETDTPELLSSLSEFSEPGTQSTASNSDIGVGGSTSVANGADLAAELDFLQQLNQALQEQPPETETSSTAPQSSSVPTSRVDSSTASALPKTPDDMGAPDELDEFYTSLFGQDAIATSGSSSLAALDLEKPIVSDLENISTEAPDSLAIAEIEIAETTDSAAPPDNTLPPIADLTAVVAVESQPVPSPAVNQVSEPGAERGTDLFGTFTDLGNVDAAIAPESRAESDVAEAVSPIFDLEDFSADFATPAATSNTVDPLAELAELLGEEPELDPPVASSAPAASDADQLTSFSEEAILGETFPDLLPTESPLASSDTATNWLEDHYTLAAPDESLLDTDDLGEANDITLLIDDQLVQQLNQDLSNIESDNSEFSLDIDLSTVPPNPTDSTTLDDLFPAENEVESEIQTPETPIVTESAPSDLTLEALDDFFGDLESTDTAPAIEAAPPAETATSSPTQYPTEVDTQSITLDDVFGDLLGDEKKKI
jgi:hypothetical protein